MIRNNLIAAVLAAFSFLLALPALAETADGLSSAAGSSVTVSEMQKEGGHDPVDDNGKRWRDPGILCYG